MTNTLCSPFAEAAYKELAPAWFPGAVSRGVVVLFSEPISPKVNAFLGSRRMALSGHGHSRQFEAGDVTPDALVLTMTLSEKVRLMEDFGIGRNLYTIGEFIGEDADVVNPMGADDGRYESFFEELLEKVERTIIRIEADYHDDGGA